MSRNKARPDLQAQVFRGYSLLGASEVRYQAADTETLDMRLAEARSAVR